MNSSTTADTRLFNAFVGCLPTLITISIDKLHLLCGNTELQEKFFALVPADDRTLSAPQLADYARHLSAFRQKYRSELQLRFRRRAALIQSPDIVVSIHEFRATQLVSMDASSQIGHACEHRLIARLEQLCHEDFRNLDALQVRYRALNKHALPNTITPTTLGASLADSFLRTPLRQQHSQAGLMYLVFLFAYEVRKQLRSLGADFGQAMDMEEFDAMRHAPRFQPFLPTIPIEFGD